MMTFYKASLFYFYFIFCYFPMRKSLFLLGWAVIIDWGSGRDAELMTSIYKSKHKSHQLWISAIANGI